MPGSKLALTLETKPEKLFWPRSSSVFAMAAADAQDPAALIAAAEAEATRVSDLEEQVKTLQAAKKQKATELKKENQKRKRLMDKASSNLSMADLATVMAVKQAKAKAAAEKAVAKAKAKAVAKAKAKAAAVPPPVPGDS